MDTSEVWKNRPKDSSYVKLEFKKVACNLSDFQVIELYRGTSKEDIAKCKQTIQDHSEYEVSNFNTSRTKNDMIYYCEKCSKYYLIDIRGIGVELKRLHTCIDCNGELEYIAPVLSKNWENGIPYFGNGISRKDPMLDDRPLTHPEEYTPPWERTDLDLNFMANSDGSLKSTM